MAHRRTLFRMLAIQRVLVKYGLDDVIKETHLWRPLRFLFHLAPRRRDSSAPLGERIRLALEELGPIFVKFGQAISTRRDLLPPDIADELAKLQDAVPPFPAEQAKAIVEQAYGEPVANVFARFDDEPLAAASIAQVHTAKLKAGTEVIVKVLRPGVEEQIERDLAVLRMLAGLADRYWQHGKRLRPLEVVDEYEHTIIDELDLMREAANTAQLKRNFQDSDMLYVPDIYWDYCRPEVLVQERIFGTPISDMETLRAAGTNIQLLAENGVEIFFTQVFRHNFFHADMHPGNIFVIHDDPEKPRYAAVDFGIVGTLSPEDQRYLAENFLAFFDPRLSPHREAASRLRVGAARHARGPARIGRTHRVRTHFQQTARRDFLRAGTDAPVPRGAAVRRRDPAAADTPAQDAVQHRGARPATLSAARSLEDGTPRTQALDGRAGRGTRPAPRRARESASAARRAAGTTGDSQPSRRASGTRAYSFQRELPGVEEHPAAARCAAPPALLADGRSDECPVRRSGAVAQRRARAGMGAPGPRWRDRLRGPAGLELALGRNLQ